MKNKTITINVDWIFLALLIFMCCSCQKQEIKPLPPREYKCLFNWGTTGFVNNERGHCVTYPDPYGPQFTPFTMCGVLVVDSCAINVNGVLTFTDTYGYHLQFTPGDTIDIYLRGQQSPDSVGTFAIWQDYNGPQRTTTFNSVAGVIQGRFIATNLRAK